MNSCPQCGETTEELHEGYCLKCLNERQSELDGFNARFDWWESLSDKERIDQIKWAM